MIFICFFHMRRMRGPPQRCWYECMSQDISASGRGYGDTYTHCGEAFNKLSSVGILLASGMFLDGGHD